MEEMIERFITPDTNRDGSGYGSGNLIGAVYNDHEVYDIDDMPIIIYKVHGNYAKGAMVNDDMTLTPCYVAKCGGVFRARRNTPQGARGSAPKNV